MNEISTMRAMVSRKITHFGIKKFLTISLCLSLKIILVGWELDITSSIAYTSNPRPIRHRQGLWGHTWGYFTEWNHISWFKKVHDWLGLAWSSNAFTSSPRTPGNFEIYVSWNFTKFVEFQTFKIIQIVILYYQLCQIHSFQVQEVLCWKYESDDKV